MQTTKAANKNKATHSGSCQICGALQKLPNGVLSKHGYNVQWGFFSGVCNGAGYLPFEQDYSLIEAAIKSVEAQIIAINKRITVLRSATGTKAWVHHYDNGRNGGKSGYYWKECEIVERHVVCPNGYEYNKVVYVGPDGKDYQTANYETDRSVAGTVAYLNEVYVKSMLQTRVTQLKQYIDWQQGRIVNWKPAELTPVK